MPDQIYCTSCRKIVPVNDAKEAHCQFKAVKDGKKHKSLQGICPKCGRHIRKPL